MEHFKQVIAWELLFILVFSSLIAIDSVENGFSAITGHAVNGPSKDAVQAELEAALPKLDFAKDVNDVSMCVIINMDSTTKYSYEVVKIGTAIAVTTSDNTFCKGRNNEDFIISYTSYDKFKEQTTNIPSFQDLRKTSDGTNFYIYPSKYISSGLKIVNPSEFSSKFGTLLRNNFNAQEINQILTSGEPETLSPSSFVSYLLYFILGLVVLVIVLGVFVFSHTKKPEIKESLELTAYIKSAASQGYGQDQIRQALLQAGWKEEQVQQAFNSLNSEVIAPPEA